MWARLALLLLLGAALAARANTAPLENVPLKWEPTSHLRLGAAQISQAAIEIGTFQDAREDKREIGENAEDDQRKPVSTNDDIGAFVSEHVRELLAEAGLKTGDSSSAVVLKGEVRQFFARETSTYKAQITLHLELVNRSGQTLWSGTASGEATRFGRSYKLENYYEVLSNALVNLVSSLLQSPQFENALSAH